MVGLHNQAITNIVEREQGQEQEQEQKNPISYAFKYLNSPETQRQYPRRLKLLFEHIGLAGCDGNGDVIDGDGREVDSSLDA